MAVVAVIPEVVDEAKVWTPPRIEGVQEALIEALKHHVGGEELEEAVQSIEKIFKRQCNRFFKDERATQRGTSTQARALIEDFVEAVMGGITTGLWERPWIESTDFSAAILAAAVHTFKTTKVVSRTLAPAIEKYVEEGYFKYQEEQRIQRAMAEALNASGVQETHKKKALMHLNKAFDDAYSKSPFDTMVADTAEKAMLQAFVKGWMLCFVGRAWDVLQHGVGANNADERLLFTTVLFQNLCDPSVQALPHEIVGALGGSVPAGPWEYVGRAAEEVFQELKF